MVIHCKIDLCWSSISLNWQYPVHWKYLQDYLFFHINLLINVKHKKLKPFYSRTSCIFVACVASFRKGEHKINIKEGDGGASLVFFSSGSNLYAAKPFHMGTLAMQADIFVSVLFPRIWWHTCKRTTSHLKIGNLLNSPLFRYRKM